MRNVCLLWLLFALASVYSESQVRETETWVPASQTELDSSGDFPNGSDFEFSDEDHKTIDDDDDYEDDFDSDSELSGSGDEGLSRESSDETSKSDMGSNNIPEQDKPGWPRPTINEMDVVRKNEVGPRPSADQEDITSNVLMAHTGDESIFNKTEVIAALIAGGSVGVVFAIILVLLLVYRMKKKDEGSYDLGKKPIYKKAPTTEIYA